jgi:hypothetical protein
MAGITANAASKTLAAGDTSADKVVTGYVLREEITLTTSPLGSSFSWSLAKPSTATVRSDLNDDDAASVRFTPDVEGYYTVTCTVDSTTLYILRIGVTARANAIVAEAQRWMPAYTTTVATPPAGLSAHYGTDEGLLLTLNASGVVGLLGLLGTVGALTDADATKSISDGVNLVLPYDTLSANRILTVSDPGTAKKVINVVRLDTNAFTYAVVNGGGGGGTQHTFASGTRGIARLISNGTNLSLHELIDL